jgi:hypothetical protein
VNNELLNALALMVNKPLNKLPRDLQSVVRKHIPLWSSMTPSERATKIGEVDRQLSVKLRIKLSRAVKASELAQDSPEYERWFEMYRQISTKRREIASLKGMNDAVSLGKIDRLRGDVAQLEATVGTPPEQWRDSDPRIARDMSPILWDSGIESYKLPAQDTATPESVVTTGDATAQSTTALEQTVETLAPMPDNVKTSRRLKRKLSIEEVALDYMREEYKVGQFSSAAKFHKHLFKNAGKAPSPFEMGTGFNARKLFCPAASSFFDVGTLGKLWPKIRTE